MTNNLKILLEVEIDRPELFIDYDSLELDFKGSYKEFFQYFLDEEGIFNIVDCDHPARVCAVIEQGKTREVWGSLLINRAHLEFDYDARHSIADLFGALSEIALGEIKISFPETESRNALESNESDSKSDYVKIDRETYWRLQDRLRELVSDFDIIDNV